MSTPKNTKTHTPTPWSVSALDYWSIVGDGKHIADCRVQDERTIGRSRDHESEANAALIVRAVNAHEALVGALESVAQAFAVEHIAEVIPPSVATKVKAALRAAKGES